MNNIQQQQASDASADKPAAEVYISNELPAAAEAAIEDIVEQYIPAAHKIN